MLPKVLHENTCAHKMNVGSTATVLPCTAADVNDSPSVMFVGPGKFHIECLKSIFLIYMQNVWDF